MSGVWLRLLLLSIAAAAIPAAEVPTSAGETGSSPSSADAREQQLIQDCSAGSPERAAIAIADGQLLPDHATRLYRILLARHDRTASLIALAGLARLGPAGRAAADDLVTVIATSDVPAVRGAAVAALWALQPTPPAVATLGVCLQDQRLPPQARADAARLLGSWGFAADPMRGALAARIDDPDGDLAGAAYAALAELSGSRLAPRSPDAPGPPVLPDEALDRQLAGFAALPAGPFDDARCASLLTVARADGRHGARIMAWSSLARGGGWDAAVVQAFTQLLTDAEPCLQQLAIQALLGEPRLGYPGPAPDPAVLQVLAQSLSGDADQVRCALGALAHFGVASAPVQPQLWALLERPGVGLEQIAGSLEVVRAWGPADRCAQERLARLLDPTAAIYAGRSHDQADAIQAMVLSTLASCGVPTAAKRWILAALASPDPVVPAAFAGAARAVISEGADGSYAVPYLLAALQPGFADAALDVDHLISLSRPRHRVAGEVPIIPAASPSARWYAIRALGAIGPAAAAALPALRQVSGHGGDQSGTTTLLQQAAAQAVIAIAGP